MVTRIFLTLCRIFLYALLLIILGFNLKLHETPAFAPRESGGGNLDLIAQDSFLRHALARGAAGDMQRLFPEGKLFMQAVTALTHQSIPHRTDERFISKLRQDTSSRRIFPRRLPLAYGAFYRGWRQLAYADDPLLFREVRAALDSSTSPFLESYHDGAWPADMVVLVAAIQDRPALGYSAAQRDTVRRITRQWVTRARRHLDPATGMLPHLVDARSGATIRGARGSSSSLMLALLPGIDAEFAEEQFRLYERYFVTSRLGLPGIREYPVDTAGRGDIDSGPVIWGIGGAASIVGQRAAGVNGRTELFLGLRAAIQAFGLAYTWRGQHRYLFGELPIVDAWTGWANAVDNQEGAVRGHYWPWWFHLLSLSVVLLLVWLIRRL